ncbi:MAG: sigma-70 family RNA polymerase sigma factor [Vicinamibacterales bacterium]
MGGDADDVADELFRTAYDELRRLAHSLRRRHDAPTLNATALVHEAYIRLLGAKRFRAQSAEHLKYTLVRAMKYVLLDAARQKASARGGGNAAARRVTLEDRDAQGAFIDPHEVLAVGSALDALARQNELQARAFELQFFGGLEIAEISRLMGLSEKKVQRLLRVARATLAVLVGKQQAVQRDVE